MRKIRSVCKRAVERMTQLAGHELEQLDRSGRARTRRLLGGLGLLGVVRGRHCLVYPFRGARVVC
uniref:Uncharacterized protein n=1 Tax=Anopheles dirus TaxID=7168 RepID=A0A182NYL6_9DIPT